MFKLSGTRPTDLGVQSGRFTAKPTWKPNWVSSQEDPADPHYVAPLAVKGEPKSAMARVKDAVRKMDRAAVITERDDYLYAEFSTPLMGFVDDVEFFADGKTVQVRSSSRLGIRDFDVNRKRVEAVRKAVGG